MSIWVSKEALAPQEWSQLCQISLKDRFRAKNVNIVISDFSFVFYHNFLCIIEVWGAQWIFNISLWFLWKSHESYPDQEIVLALLGTWLGAQNPTVKCDSINRIPGKLYLRFTYHCHFDLENLYSSKIIYANPTAKYV